MPIDRTGYDVIQNNLDITLFIIYWEALIATEEICEPQKISNLLFRFLYRSSFQAEHKFHWVTSFYSSSRMNTKGLYSMYKELQTIRSRFRCVIFVGSFISSWGQFKEISPRKTLPSIASTVYYWHSFCPDKPIHPFCRALWSNWLGISSKVPNGHRISYTILTLILFIQYRIGISCAHNIYIYIYL